MDSAHLTAAQARRLAEAVAHGRDYLVKLCARMAALQFPEADPLHASGRRARDAVDALLFAIERVERQAAEAGETPRWIAARRT